MTRRDLVLAVLGLLSAVLIVLMLFVTVLGVVGRGLLGELMRDTHGVMFFVMVGFPLYAVVLTAALGWWIFRREGR
ncbi:MAG: hypothetical protein M3281_04050 [Chloroflexota bacterium]|nr:hypothetical protein [Chloroflexota bacterium]